MAAPVRQWRHKLSVRAHRGGLRGAGAGAALRCVCLMEAAPHSRVGRVLAVHSGHGTDAYCDGTAFFKRYTDGGGGVHSAVSFDDAHKAVWRGA